MILVEIESQFLAFGRFGFESHRFGDFSSEDQNRFPFAKNLKAQCFVAHGSEDLNSLPSPDNVSQGPKAAKYLRGRLPLEIVYRKEIGSRSEASKEELRIKRMGVKGKMGLVSAG